MVTVMMYQAEVSMKSILLVDDDVFLLNVIVSWLNFQMPDYRILTGSNGRAGMEILKQNSFDLIMTDIRMPVMDGFQFIEQKNSICRETPLIAMTSDYSEEVITRLKALGVTRCLEKPFKFELLADNLLEAMHTDRNTCEVLLA
jgi:two-component system response regulator YesN